MSHVVPISNYHDFHHKEFNTYVQRRPINAFVLFFGMAQRPPRLLQGDVCVVAACACLITRNYGLMGWLDGLHGTDLKYWAFKKAKAAKKSK